MSDRDMFTDAVDRLLGERCTPEVVRSAEETGFPRELWDVLDQNGFTRVSLPESAGGSGGTLADACAVLSVAGRYAAPVPLAEAGILAGWALTSAGLPLPEGFATVASGQSADTLALTADGDGWRLSGTAHRVAHAASSARIVLVSEVSEVSEPEQRRRASDTAQWHVVSIPTELATITPGRNLAGEPRDRVDVDGVRLAAADVRPAPPGVDAVGLRLRGALSRAALIAGAAARVGDLTVGYTNTRQQFGRPIARFQAVARHLVRIAEQTEQVKIAAITAAENAVPEPAFFDVAAAKILAGEAATAIAAAAHQAHGAIGMTREYELGQLSRRLWAWRDEYGSDREWSRRLGADIAAAGADALWPRIATGRTAHEPA